MKREIGLLGNTAGGLKTAGHIVHRRNCEFCEFVNNFFERVLPPPGIYARLCVVRNFMIAEVNQKLLC